MALLGLPQASRESCDASVHTVTWTLSVFGNFVLDIILYWTSIRMVIKRSPILSPKYHL